jgi:energy-coupling factor transporter ATP-binding protein EcfA2
MGHPIVEVAGLRFRYPDGTEALRGIDLRVEASETLVLLGANGSGKTTFLLHLNGLLRGDGRIAIAGVDLTTPSLQTIRSKVGLVFQNADDQVLMPTVLQDVAFGLLNHGCETTLALNKARAMLDQLHLGHLADREPHHLSEGEKRRVALAGVLVMEPELLVLDEPTTSLDPPGQREFTALLLRQPQAKIVSTHDVSFASKIATRAVFFDNGLITDEGTVEEVARRQGWE